MSQQELEPNRGNIDWRKELGSEMQDSHYFYVVHKDPDTVGGFVLRAVYKTLTGDEAVTEGENSFIHDSTNIRDEQTEVLARGLMDQVRAIRKANGGDDIDREEAVKQSKAAIASMNSTYGFMARYDYWGMSPIKAGVNLHDMQDHPEYYLASAKLATLGDLVGFPYNLLSRTLKREAGSDPLGFLVQAAPQLGIDPEQMIQRMYQSEAKMAFVEAMNDAGHTNFDHVRSAIDYSGERGHRELTPEEMFEMISGKERNIVQRPRQERLKAEVAKEIKAGQSSGRLELNLWTQGNVWYDPESKTMKGQVVPDQYDVLYANVRPLITPNTRHEDLLEVRRQAQTLVKELGFSEPSRNLYW
jgi:hypothetical protein